MKLSYSKIKNNAKKAMKGHIGEVILVALILPIAFSMIGSFFAEFFGFIHWSLPTFITSLVGAVATYITLRMVIKIVRFKSDEIFKNFFGTKNGILNSIAFSIFSIVFVSGYVIIFWDYFILAWDFIQIMPSDYFASDPDALEAWFNNQVINKPSIGAIVVSIIYSIIIIIISIWISFTKYVIADSDLNMIDAMKRSWKITSGNWWRILIFPFSFILWSFAVIFTLGIAVIYVGPYITISYGALYDQLLVENGFGDSIESGINVTPVKEDLTDEFALDEDKDEFDKKDPFEDYYE